jgi:hypothetical protein
MPEPSFEEQKINWLESLLCLRYPPTAERPAPDWVPCRVRLKTGVKNFQNGTDWGVIASEGAEIEVQATVFGLPVFVQESDGLQVWLNPSEVEVLAFVPNVKKKILEKETADACNNA